MAFEKRQRFSLSFEFRKKLSEGSVSFTNLTITPSTWNTTNQVTLTGQDDSDNDGNITFRISFGNATSTDSKYNGMAPSPAFVDVINVDDYED